MRRNKEIRDGRPPSTPGRSSWHAVRKNFCSPLSFVNERHIHIVRTLLALVPDGAQDGFQWEKRVLYGPFPDDVYSALAAVTASIFSTMAVYERGPRGRARRERVPGVLPDSPTVVAFANAGLRVPRHVVASLCKVAGSVATSQRLLLLERGRTKSKLRAAAFCCWRGVIRRVVCQWCSSASMGLG